MKVVFSIGGSILAPDNVDEEYLRKLSALIEELAKNHQVAVVVGGGRPARRAIEDARNRGSSWAECDHVGILKTRENARELINRLNVRCNKKIPESIYEAVALFGRNVLVTGGTEPGHSTDAVAAIIAEWVKADIFVNASNVDAVYDKNPKEYPDAKPYKTIDIKELIKIVCEGSMEAGKYPLLDLTSARIIERSKIKTVILDGREVGNMKNAVEGQPFAGTTVLF